MLGKHLTQKERFYIEKRRSDGVNQATIARELELPRSTISRELRRNTDAAFNGVYSCRRAETLASGRRQKARPDNVINQLEPHIQDFIREALSTHTSPEVISGRLFLEFDLSVSKNSLYRYIQQERRAGGELYQQLPHRGKRYNYQSDENKRGPIPNRVGIEQRPAEADLKQEPGHFEIDTISGKDQKSFLLTVVDKAVKLVIIRKLPNKRAETVVAAFRDIVANTFCEFKTLTADNGSECSQHEEITKITGAPVYFARPYHSWERGLNEHTNGLIRRFYPKGTDFNQVTHRKVPNKRAETVVAAFRDIVANTFCEFKTLTADNGSECSQHEEITKITGAPVYFARPYHSWERGLNEHTNGLIRRFYPKGTDFNQVTHRKVAALEHLLNTRGRKCLGYRSPNEVFLTHLQAA